MDISFLTEALRAVEVQPLSLNIFLTALLAAILLVVSGFASGSEIAFFSLSPTDLTKLDAEKNAADASIQMLRDDSDIDYQQLCQCDHHYALQLHF